ncbi:MAG: four helix bundle protein [Terriglobales bacterium]
MRILRLYRSLPRTDEARILGTQLLRSSTSVGANYRAACRGRSRAEFIAKLGVVLERSRRDSLLVGTLRGGKYFPRLKNLLPWRRKQTNWSQFSSVLSALQKASHLNASRERSSPLQSDL